MTLQIAAANYTRQRNLIKDYQYMDVSTQRIILALKALNNYKEVLRRAILCGY